MTPLSQHSPAPPSLEIRILRVVGEEHSADVGETLPTRSPIVESVKGLFAACWGWTSSLLRQERIHFRLSV